MLIVWGHKYDFEPLIGSVEHPCPECRRKTTALYWARKKGTVYWIPLFTLEEGYAVGCDVCKKHWIIDQAVGKRLHQPAQERVAALEPTPVAAEQESARKTAPAAEKPPAAPAPAAQTASPPCAICGAALPEGARFCAECGAPAAPPAAKTCAACGHSQAAGKFCEECGAPFDAPKPRRKAPARPKEDAAVPAGKPGGRARKSSAKSAAKETA